MMRACCAALRRVCSSVSRSIGIRAETARDDRGYTLVEMMISMLLMTILLGSLYTVLFQSQATFEAQQDAMALRQQARVAINQLSTELRMAGYDIGNVPEAIPDARANRVVFIADIDNGSNLLPCGAAAETAVNGGAERITNRLLTGDLLRSVDCWDGATWTTEYTDQIVARNLVGSDPIFRYFDANGTEMDPGGGALTAAQRAALRMLNIALALEDPSNQVLGETSDNFAMQTRVTLRNAGP